MTFVTKQSKYKMCYFITSCNTFHKLTMLTCRCSKNCQYLAKWEMWVLSEFTDAWIFLSIFGKQEEQKNKYIHTYIFYYSNLRTTFKTEAERDVCQKQWSQWVTEKDYYIQHLHNKHCPCLYNKPYMKGDGKNTDTQKWNESQKKETNTH